MHHNNEVVKNNNSTINNYFLTTMIYITVFTSHTAFLPGTINSASVVL